MTKANKPFTAKPYEKALREKIEDGSILLGLLALMTYISFYIPLSIDTYAAISQVAIVWFIFFVFLRRLYKMLIKYVVNGEVLT